MEITYKQLHLINFPIYGLSSEDLEVTDGLLRSGHTVVDDRNQIGDTLGARRLQTPHKLCKLKVCYEDIPGLINAKHKVFVDTKGYCFIYKKTRFVSVHYHKIIKVSRKEVATTITASGVSFPVVVKRPPPVGTPWLAMMYLDKRPWLPYAYSEVYCASMKRKI